MLGAGDRSEAWGELLGRGYGQPDGESLNEAHWRDHRPQHSLGHVRNLKDHIGTAAEMALSVLGYNLTRVMNIVGIKPLIAAIRA